MPTEETTHDGKCSLCGSDPNPGEGVRPDEGYYMAVYTANNTLEFCSVDHFHRFIDAVKED